MNGKNETSVLDSRAQSHITRHPKHDLYGEAPPERGTFFEVYERVGKSVILMGI